MNSKYTSKEKVMAFFVAFMEKKQLYQSEVEGQEKSFNVWDFKNLQEGQIPIRRQTLVDCSGLQR